MPAEPRSRDGSSSVEAPVVAVITAVLSVVMEGPFAVCSIRPVEAPGAAPWARAGVLQQQLTRIFFRRGRWM